MSTSTSLPNITLQASPLAEAWLDIRWKLDTSDENPMFKQDESFPYALGNFYSLVKSKFGYRENLDISILPVDISPYRVRHRFRTKADGWPLLQLGPGIASFNMTQPYDWNTFKEGSLFLRESVVSSYEDMELVTDTVILHYRNAFPFDYTDSDLLRFLREKLNFSLTLPKTLPGTVVSTENPTSANLQMTFDLSAPKGTGALRLSTGSREVQNGEETITENIVIEQIDISSGGSDAPDINDATPFGNWLDDAHNVAHEWFFAIIDGDLRKRFEKGS